MKDMCDMYYEASYDIYHEAAYAGGCGGADMSNSKTKGSDNSRKKIIITNDGKVTKAKYFDNEKLMCTGIATCHENDMFDVFKGAELSLERCKAKNTINDRYGYRTAPSNIQKFMDGDLAVDCRLNQVVEFLDWCKEREIDISRENNIKTYEQFMKYNYIIFYIDDEDELAWVGYNNPGDSGIRYMTYTKRVISFDDFFKLPEGVSIE